VRKVDIHLILPLFVLFIFNILDRSNIASARLGGLQEDLNLSDTQYQTSVSILVSQLPIYSRATANRFQVRWLSFGTNPEQYRPHPRQAISIPPNSDAYLGCHLTLYRCLPQIRRHPDGSIFPRFRRVSILCWCIVSWTFLYQITRL
jgi:hypothetical protein